MPLITFVLMLVAVGVLLWLVNKSNVLEPMPRNVLSGCVVCVVFLWVFTLLGAFGSTSALHLGHIVVLGLR